MISPLIGRNRNYPTLLQQIADDVGSSNGMVISEKDLHVFTKSTRIIISHCFCITECLQQRITSKYLLLYRVTLSVTQTCQHFHAVFGRLGLPCTRLSRYDDGLLALAASQPLEGLAGYHIDMG